MSANNNCQFFGRLVRDPELHTDTDPKKTRAKFTIAVDRVNKAKADADFIDCVAFGRNAENIATFFKKGRGILVNGPYQIDSYTDRDGIKRKAGTLIIDSWAFDGSPRDSRQAPEQSDPLAWANGAASAADSFEAVEEDVPF